MLYCCVLCVSVHSTLELQSSKIISKFRISLYSDLSACGSGNKTMLQMAAVFSDADTKIRSPAYSLLNVGIA